MAGGGAPAGDDLLANVGETGFKGLFHNRKSFGLAAFASIGGVLYGYNQGVFGQVQVMTNFHNRYPATLDNSTTKGLLTAILGSSQKAALADLPELGAFLGSLCAGPLADIFSRKYSISGWCVVFMMGVAIQVGANNNVACIYCELCGRARTDCSRSLVRGHGRRCLVHASPYVQCRARYARYSWLSCCAPAVGNHVWYPDFVLDWVGHNLIQS